MPAEQSSDVKFEIGHVLFIDIVGYSKLLINQQTDQLDTLKAIVRGTEQVQKAVEATKPGEALSTTSIGFVVQLGIAQGLAGHQDEARATLTRAIQAIKPTPETQVPVGSLGLPTILSLAYSGLGDKEKALAQAREAVADYATDAVAKPGAEANLAQIQAPRRSKCTLLRGPAIPTQTIWLTFTERTSNSGRKQSTRRLPDYAARALQK